VFRGELLPIVVLYGRTRRGGLRGCGLPCGGCQRFESAYLQPVNLADTMTAPIFPIRQFDLWFRIHGRWGPDAQLRVAKKKINLQGHAQSTRPRKSTDLQDHTWQERFSFLFFSLYPISISIAPVSQVYSNLFVYTRKVPVRCNGHPNIYNVIYNKFFTII
jgi:hypothetical protein